MKIKTFGKLTDVVTEPLEQEFPVSVREFRQSLIQSYPALNELDFKIAVNHQIVDEETFIIKEEDLVALLPPFSGG